MSSIIYKIFKCPHCHKKVSIKVEPNVPTGVHVRLTEKQKRNSEYGKLPFKGGYEMTEKEIVLSCPFCGTAEVEICRTNENACWVQCAYCGAESDSKPLRADAIKIWNDTHKRVQAVITSDDDKDW